MSANWAELKRILAGVEERLTLSWAELERISDGLPPSAFNHPPYWKGKRSGWPGFTTTDVRVGHSVTFVRKGSGTAGIERARAVRRESRTTQDTSSPPDVVLVGCVKLKLDHAAPAKDLYVSPLFRKERAYAESVGRPWYILSAEYGLLPPDRIVEPYELRIDDLAGTQRAAWGEAVARDLAAHIEPLADKVVEVHAGAAYVDAVREPLESAGAHIRTPLAGLTMGQRLAWYGATSSPADLGTTLGSGSGALAPDDFVARGPEGLRKPGLYSWWVDEQGAQDLTRGLGSSITEGLIYAGLAGATRTKSGRKSTNTLWGRIEGMHLGSRHEFSTFRLSLGSVLAESWSADAIDEARLSDWMRHHLRVVAVPVDDADTLDGLETDLLAQLDPPLNLSKMQKTEIRRSLSALRKRYSARTR